MGISNNIDFVKQKLSAVIESYNKDINVILSDLNGFKSSLIHEGIDNVSAAQIIMMLEVSNVSNYLCYDNSSSVDMVDVNNCVINAERTCGFSRGVVQELLTVIFSSFGYESVFIDGKFSYSKDDTIKRSGHIYGKEDYGEKLSVLNREIDNYLTQKENEDSDVDEKKEKLDSVVKEHFELLNKLVEQENPDALYISGKCYLHGLGTKADSYRALQLLERASAVGNAEAGGYLGDCYFSLGSDLYLLVPNKLTKTYECYTRLGAAANRPDRQERLVALIENKKVNLRLLISSAFVYVAFLVYEIMLMCGELCPSGCPHYVTGIIGLVLSTGLMVLMVLNYIIARFDSPKGQVFSMALMFCIFSIIAMI